MDETIKTIKVFAQKLPRFPDGRIDYSNSKEAPVVNVFVKHQDKILLLKRSERVCAYAGKWNAVSGFLDEVRPIKEKVFEELQEELGISRNMVQSIHLGKSWRLNDKKINKIWLINPILVELKIKPNIKLDWEHTDYKWIKPEEILDFDPSLREGRGDIVTRLDKSLENAINKNSFYG